MKKQKIIIITSRFPFPLNKGDKLRIYYQIKHLAIYHNIYLISLNTEGVIKKIDRQELEKYCKEVHVININIVTRLINVILAFFKKEPLQVGYFYSKTAHTKIKHLIQKIDPDWCYGQLIRTAKYIGNYDNNIIDYMDAFSKGVERRVRKFPKCIQPLIKYEARVIRNYEISVFNNFKKHSIITKNDQNYISHKDAGKIEVIPNGVDTNYFKPIDNSTKKYDIIFVGNMNYPPNIEAAIYICKKIKPIIDKKYRTCTILIGGTNPNKKIKKLQNDDITISGWVKDIRSVYSSGHIFVAPMFIGTGLQNKLLEAMAMGVPCITTELANKALLANSSQIIISNNEMEFADACIDVFKNQEKATNLRHEGLKFIQEKYDWSKINNNLNLMFK
tara:strand:+ start:707 stop:1873 length:1167 start_codon:yes stop_codon:yes gene_type:complete